MTINSYFKTSEEINQLFQKAYDALKQHGYDAAASLFEDAFRHDPYRPQAHYKLALYFASINSYERFKERFFICRNIDPAYAEKISTDEIVLNAIGTIAIAEIAASKELHKRWCKREFASVDPPDGNTWLMFKPNRKKAIHDLYVTLDKATTKYFRARKKKGESSIIYEEYSESDFDQLDCFELGHLSGWDEIDCSPEALYTALRRLSEYLENNVRFLVTSEWDEFIDEVIILNGAFHIYRHQTGPRDYFARLEFIKTLINSYPEDRMLRSWLCREYQTILIYRINYDVYDTIYDTADTTVFLEEAIRLSTPEDPWMPFVLGKLAIYNGDRETALKWFKEAAAKKSDIFDIYYELGKLQVTHFKDYSEGIEHLSTALQLDPSQRQRILSDPCLAGLREKIKSL